MKRREAITVEFTVFRRKPRKTDWWQGKYMIHAYDQVYWVNEIKHAVEKSYGVTVVKVNTINVDGKRKFRYTAKGIIEGRSQSYKKAIIKLQAGETIDFYANV